MLCDCGHDAVSYSVRMTPRGRKTVCRNCVRPKMRESVANPYDLTLEHVHDGSGQPLHVGTLAELRRAEKQYKFRSLVANELSANFDKPPQKPKPDLFEAMDESGGWGDNRDACRSMVRELRESGEIPSA
jgi:hypothetical protein